VADASPPTLLAGRRGLVAVVSGEDSIGFQCAYRLRHLGARVAIAHRPARHDLAARLRERAGAELALPLEVREEETVAAAFRALDAAWGGLDFLVHTVMHVPDGVLAAPLVALRREDFRDVLDDAAYSLVLLARHAQPLLARSPAGRIVAFSSAGSQRAMPGYHVAGIAKAALESCARYLAAELGPSGVLCNVVSPSLLITDGASRAVGRANAEATRAHLAKKSPLRQAVGHADVADVVAFLCSEHCRGMTAEVLTLDGGFSKNYF